jgi:pleckstrin domain-containing family G protein 5
MDAHCFLFADMLLVCKGMGRKGEKMKVIRQPYAVDRLLVRDLSKDPGAFGLVYLNEYGTASAALTLHSSEPKLVKVWTEHIKKAQKLYAEAKHKVNT